MIGDRDATAGAETDAIRGHVDPLAPAFAWGPPDVTSRAWDPHARLPDVGHTRSVTLRLFTDLLFLCFAVAFFYYRCVSA